MKIPYSKAVDLLEEGDVLLYRGRGLISWLIKTYSYGTHSHAAIFTLSNNIPMCCEMREFKGGRCVHLKRQVDEQVDRIDVFRAISHMEYDEVSVDGLEYKKTKCSKTLDNTKKNKITELMRGITGSSYGWWNIWLIVKHYIPFLRLMKPKTKDDTQDEVFICSSAVAYCYRMAYEDPVPFLPDHMVTPSDLARSPLLKYQFTIERE